MERSEEFAVSLLGYIERNDHDGVGLYRSELRKLFEDDPGSKDVSEDQKWVVADYHLRLLESAGFVTRDPDSEGKNDLDNYELTWAGHEYFEKNAPSDFVGIFDVHFP